MQKLRLGLGLRARVSNQSFDPMSLAPAAFYDPSDMATLFQDSAGTVPVTASGQPVGRMADKSGNGLHLIQATASARPIYTESGGLKYLAFDGVDDLMIAPGLTGGQFDRITALIYNVDNYQSVWESLYGPNSYFRGLKRRQSDGYCMYGPADGVSVPAPLIGQNHVIVERQNGVNSRIKVNNNSYVSDTSLDTADPSSGRRLVYGANLHFFGAFIKNGAAALSDPDIALLVTFFAAKQGQVL